MDQQYQQFIRYKSMGNSVSVLQSDISDSLREEYQIESQAHLFHKATHELCTLRKITTSSQSEAERICRIIDEYGKNKCQSICQLKNSYHSDRKDYCNQEQTFFLIFQGANDYTLREEFVKRRFYHAYFQEQEIQQIIETYICGLKEYSQSFQRQYPRLSLDCIAINPETRKIFLKDAWLIDHSEQDHMDNMTQLLLSYPSPEKLSCAYTYKIDDYNEFYSNLFSVGMIAMEISSMDFVDKIYARKKEVDYPEVARRLRGFKDEKLRRGVQCLLDINPNERKRVYQIWGIQKGEEHYLTTLYSPEPQAKFRQRHISSPSRGSLNPHITSISSIQLPDIQQPKFHPLLHYDRINFSSLQQKVPAPYKPTFSSPSSEIKRLGKMNMNAAPLASSPRLRISFSNQKQSPSQSKMQYALPRVPPIMIQTTHGSNLISQRQVSPINKVIGMYNQNFNYGRSEESSRQAQHREPPFWRGNTIVSSPIKAQTPMNWIPPSINRSPQSKKAIYFNQIYDDSKQIKWVAPQQQIIKNQYH